jgi:glutaredoxin
LCFQIYIKQNRIKLILDGKKIPYEEIDLSKNQEVREEMRARAGIPDLLPPQIFNGDTYCGVIPIAQCCIYV